MTHPHSAVTSGGFALPFSHREKVPEGRMRGAAFFVIVFRLAPHPAASASLSGHPLPVGEGQVTFAARTRS
jgi:hypothetical protein